MKTTDRSTWWSITAYNEEIDTMQDLIDGKIECPPWIKQIYGGQEQCPSTGTIHFQGALNTTHTRLSQIKGLLPTSHIEAVKSTSDCLKRYVMKEETSVGEKSKLSNPKFITLEGLMELVAVQFLDTHGILNWDRLEEIYPNSDRGYDALTYEIVREKPYLANLCSQPQSLRCWSKYGQAFCDNALDSYQGE